MINILVVDLNVSTLFRVKHMLEEYNIAIEQTKTIQETINRIVASNPPFDLVILDVRLGGEDAYSLMGRLHNTFPNLLLFVLTGVNTRRSFIEAIKNGAADYVLKPYEDGYLQKKLIQHIQSIELFKSKSNSSPKQVEASIFQAVKKAVKENSELLVGLAVIYHSNNAEENFTNAKDIEILSKLASLLKSNLNEGDELFERGSNALVIVMPKRPYALKGDFEKDLQTQIEQFLKNHDYKNTYIASAFVSLPNEVDKNVNALSVLAEQVEGIIKGK